MTTTLGEEITKTEDSITFVEQEMQHAVTALEIANAARSVSLKVPNRTQRSFVEKCPSLGQHLESQCHPDSCSPIVFLFVLRVS